MYPAVIVTGLRQAGKATLLREVKKEIKYVTLHPIEITMTGDPSKSDIAAFKCLDRLQNPAREGGGIACMCGEPSYVMAKHRAFPVNFI